MDTIAVILGVLSGGLGLMGGLCAVIVPLAILTALGVYLYRQSKKRSAAMQQAQSWPHTTGMVITSQVRSRRTGNSTSHFPVVVYTYEVKGKGYQSQVIKAGDQYMSVRVMGQAQATVDRYSVGSKVTVYYNPEDPKQSALER